MLRDLLTKAYPDLSPTEQRVARYMLDHLDDVAFMNSVALARAVGVHPGSVTRFAQRLNFRGYPELQRFAQQHVRPPPALPAQLEDHDTRSTYWTNEQRNLQRVSELDHTLVDTAVTLLDTARKVYVTGQRGSEASASLAHYYLHLLRPDVHLLPSDTASRPERLLDATPDDLAVIFTLGRYAKATTRTAGLLHTQQVPILLISDGGPTPINAAAHLTLSVPVRTVGPFSSVTAMLSLAQYLAVCLAQRRGVERLKQAEQQWAEHDIFEV